MRQVGYRSLVGQIQPPSAILVPLTWPQNTGRGTKGHDTVTHTIFVICTDRCDEVVIVTFTARLREAGYRVQLVSLFGPIVRGINGIGIACDMTVSDALAVVHGAVAVIMPDSGAGLGHGIDPRMDHFLAQASEAHALVVRCTANGDLTATSIPNLLPSQQIVYRKGMPLEQIVDLVIGTLPLRSSSPA